MDDITDADYMYVKRVCKEIVVNIVIFILR